MQVTGQQNFKRLSIDFFDGINGQVASNIAKREEIFHAENARSPKIGTIEKREGMSIVGIKDTGGTFTAENNYGLFFFKNDGALNTGLYRISQTIAEGNTQAYYLKTDGTWQSVSAGDPYYSVVPVETVSSCSAAGDMYLACRNGRTKCILGSNGTSVLSSYFSTSYTTNSLIRAPQASIVNYYKSRLYLADYISTSGSITFTGSSFKGEWSSTTTYYKGDTVSFGSATPPIRYVSLQSSNINKAPTVETSYWKQYSPLPAPSDNWNIAVNYGIGSVVSYGGYYWINMVSPNVGNTPSVLHPEIWDQLSSTANWNTAITYGLNSIVLYNGFYYLSLVQPNVGNIPSSSPTKWVRFDENLNDLTDTGYYNGVDALPVTYTIVIDGVSTPNTFKWKKNSGSYTSGVAITGDDQVLSGEVRIKFGSTIGHAMGNLWELKYVRYKDAILKSSCPMGILAIVNNDATIDATSIDVTDSKYILPGETLEVRRGNTTITRIIVASVNETNISITPLTVAVQAADELWVDGTASGTKKVFRWVANSNPTGVDAKSFDSFRLSTSTEGDAEETKMMTNVGNVMMIGSNNGLAIWNDYTLRHIDAGIGCVSKQGYVKCTGSLFFLHYTGIYQTEGEAPQLISEKVARYISGATKNGLENAVAGKKEKSIFFAIGNVTLYYPDGSVEKVLPYVELEYNLVQKNWFVHTNIKATAMATYPEVSDPNLLVMTTTQTNKPVVNFLAPGVYADIDEEIHFRIDTSNMQIGTLFERFSYPQEVVIEMERGAGLKCFTSLDLAKWYELEGEAEKGVTILKANTKQINDTRPPRCRNIALSLRHSAKQLCKISKLAINYATSAEEELQSTNESQPISNLT